MGEDARRGLGSDRVLADSAAAGFAWSNVARELEGILLEMLGRGGI